MPLTVVTPPAEEPVTLDEVIRHLNLQGSDYDDALLDLYIKAVRRNLEDIGGFALVTQTLEWAQDLFPDWCESNPFMAITLPRPPLQSITSITYLDTAGVPQVLNSAEYTTDIRSIPGRVFPVINNYWPATTWRPNAVVVRYVAGYGTSGQVPEDYRSMLMLAIGTLYEYREDLVAGDATSTLPHTTGVLQRLLGPRRVWVTA